MISRELATEAAYYRFGFEWELLTEKQVMHWADETIACLDEPPLPIVELAFAKTKPQISKCLSEIGGQPDLKHAERMLFSLLPTDFASDLNIASQVCRIALGIARSTHQDENSVYDFQHILDDLDCVQRGLLGADFSDVCLSDLSALLKKNAEF